MKSGLFPALSLLLVATAVRAFQDPLDTPASASALAAKSVLVSVANAQDGLVAVGARGHILTSSDGGNEWRQVSVPVSSDLTALHFSSAKQGSAVGHDGVGLHNGDSGRTQSKQLQCRPGKQ